MALTAAEWTNLILAATAVVQTMVAIAIFFLTRALNAIQRDQFTRAGPFFRVFFNGFQNQPKEPKDEVLTFMFTIVNEGRTPARIANWGLRLQRRGERPDEWSLHAVPFEHVNWAKDEHGHHAPVFPDPTKPAKGDGRNDLFVPANDTRQYIAFLPANSGYDRFAPPTLVATPVGGPEATLDLKDHWRLFWL